MNTVKGITWTKAGQTDEQMDNGIDQNTPFGF